jgi:hypothetical protein
MNVTEYEKKIYFTHMMNNSYISSSSMATSFSGGGSWSTQREPLTMGKQLVNFYHLRLRVKCTLFCNLQNQVQTHAVLVIGFKI